MLLSGHCDGHGSETNLHAVAMYDRGQTCEGG